MAAAIEQIPLGTYDDYELTLERHIGTPPALVAVCPDRARCRTYSPRLLGVGMLLSNDAIREAYDRAVALGYGSMVAC